MKRVVGKRMRMLRGDGKMQRLKNYSKKNYSGGSSKKNIVSVKPQLN